jgi:transcriptional regulator with XRE-family HTH domain
MNDRIRQIRKALGKTQQEFADSLDTSRNNVAGWETGTRTPSATALALICTRHNVNKSFLFEGKGEMFVEMSRDEELAEFFGKIQCSDDDSFPKQFMEVLKDLDEDEWEVLAKMAVKLASKIKKD